METVQMPNNSIGTEPQKEGKGAWFAIIIIILIVIIGGIYFLLSKQGPVTKTDESAKVMKDSKTGKSVDEAQLISDELNVSGDINIDAELDALNRAF